MKIKEKKEFGVVGIDVFDINNKEMRQMHELKKRIDDVLISHKPDNSGEKKYIKDDDLKLMYAVLHVFTKDYASTQTSAFDDALEEFDRIAKGEEKPSAMNPGEDDQTFA